MLSLLLTLCVSPPRFNICFHVVYKFQLIAYINFQKHPLTLSLKFYYNFHYMHELLIINLYQITRENKVTKMKVLRFPTLLVSTFVDSICWKVPKSYFFKILILTGNSHIGNQSFMTLQKGIRFTHETRRRIIGISFNCAIILEALMYNQSI